MITLKFNVEGQYITSEPLEKQIISDSINEIEAIFSFSSDWDNITKVAIIKTNGNTYNITLVEDKISAENLPVFKAGNVVISVFGGNLKTCNCCILSIKQSGFTDSGMSVVNFVPSIADFEHFFEGKVNITDIVDNLISTDTDKPLSANQGKILNEKISSVDNLISTDTDKPLSANQGKVLKGLIDGIKLAIFPIGSLYTNAVNTNPSTFLGGTWVQVAQGLQLVGVGTGTDQNGVTKTFTAGANEGEYKHVLTKNELPKLTDVAYATTTGTGGGAVMASAAITNAAVQGMISSNNANGGQAHNNVSPTYGLYVWQRTA